MAEEAAAVDLISAGRLQLGVSRGSPEPALNGAHAFGYVPAEGVSETADARERIRLFRAAIAGLGLAPGNPQMTGSDVLLPLQPQSLGLDERIWWGSGTRETARWAGEQGMNLQSSTLLSEDTGVPFGDLQAEQIQIFRDAFAAAGWTHQPRVSVSRSILPITTDEDRRYFGRSEDNDQVGLLEGVRSRFGRSYSGEPDAIVEDLLQDAAVREADTLLLTVPNQLGVAYNARLLETVVKDIAPALGWR